MPVDISIDTDLLDERRALGEATGWAPRRQAAIAEPTGAIQAALLRPPTTNGMRSTGSGGSVPVRRRKTCRRRRPSRRRADERCRVRHRCDGLVAGSTSQTSNSCRSSPPTPTPIDARPGACSASVAIWRAATSGWRSAKSITPRWRPRQGSIRPAQRAGPDRRSRCRRPDRRDPP